MENRAQKYTLLDYYRYLLVIVPFFLLLLTGCEILSESEKEKDGRPDGPETVTADYVYGLLVVSWSPVADANSYNLYWKVTNGIEVNPDDVDTYSIEDVTSPFTFTFPDFHKKDRVSSYEFGISAMIGDQESKLSDGVEGGVFNGKIIAEPNEEQIEIWSSGSCICGNNSTMEIWWDTQPVEDGEGNHVSVSMRDAGYTHTNLTSGTTYYYAVYVTNDWGNSEVFKLSSSLVQ